MNGLKDKHENGRAGKLDNDVPIPTGLIAGTQIFNRKETLLFGIGNSGRRDDGLGWAFLEGIERQGGFRGKLLHRYQLQVEDAELVSKCRQVIFIDAFKGELEKGFAFQKCFSEKDFSFTTHSLKPEAILYLSENLYAKAPPAHLLMIEGKEWGLKMGLSKQAKLNLKMTMEWFCQYGLYV